LGGRALLALPQQRSPGTNRPAAKLTAQNTSRISAAIFSPSALQRGAKLLMRKPEAKVPSSRSAPPQRSTQRQNSASAACAAIQMKSESM